MGLKALTGNSVTRTRLLPRVKLGRRRTAGTSKPSWLVEDGRVSQRYSSIGSVQKPTHAHSQVTDVDEALDECLS